MNVLNLDCRMGLSMLPDNSVDAILTDPPYEIGIHGKAWDSTGIAFDVNMWREALRVLKPGGHILAFGAARTYHRLACAIEDAGAEVRDQIQWIYASGFPKSHNLDNLRGTKTCGCMVQSAHDTKPHSRAEESASGDTARNEPTTEYDMRSMLNADVSASVNADAQRGQILQQGLPEQSASFAGRAQLPGSEDGRGKSCMEGRRDDVQTQGELQEHPIYSGIGLVAADGAQGRLHHGASCRDGQMVRLPADANGSSTSHQSRSDRQPAQQSGTVAGQPITQVGGAWPLCAGCGLPMVPKGLGTGLKPTHEPICMARKPLVGTVAENVLAHGTGAINIEACRVPIDPVADASQLRTMNVSQHHGRDGWGMNTGSADPAARVLGEEGRWPANLIHEGLETEWARFFYCAKPSKSEKGVDNNHPTVKPVALGRYLAKLVCPAGGLILDMFAGSGSFGVAAQLEGFQYIGFDDDPASCELANRRLMLPFPGGA